MNFLFCCKMPPIHLLRSVKEIDKLKTIVNRRESIDGLETHKNYNISHYRERERERERERVFALTFSLYLALQVHITYEW